MSICKRENWGHTQMYDPKNPLVSLLTENICSYFCNYLAPNVFRCDNNAEKGTPPHPFYHTNMVLCHNFLQIDKDARSFLEAPLFNRVRIFQVRVRFKRHGDFGTGDNLALIARIFFAASRSRA